jgi:hypothetical protein
MMGEKTKKSFGEIWDELNDEQKEYLKGYIDRQRQDAVKHYQSEQLTSVYKLLDFAYDNCKDSDLSYLNELRDKLQS